MFLKPISLQHNYNERFKQCIYTSQNYISDCQIQILLGHSVTKQWKP